MYGYIINVYRSKYNISSCQVTDIYITAFYIYLEEAAIERSHFVIRTKEHFLILARSGSSKPCPAYYSFETQY